MSIEKKGIIGTLKALNARWKLATDPIKSTVLAMKGDLDNMYLAMQNSKNKAKAIKY